MASVEIRAERALSRRDVMMAGAAVGATLIVGGGTSRAARAMATPGLRIGIVGGGMAGLETAWLLDGTHTVTLLERDDVIGGHATTVDVTVGDSSHLVDVGAQYFAERSYPNFWKLATSMLSVPVVPATMTIAMWDQGAHSLTFSSQDPAANLENALAMLSLTTAAQTDWGGPDRRGTGPWDVTLAEYIEPFDMPRASKDDFVYPLLAALNGTSTEENKTVAARAGLAFLVRPVDLADPLGIIYHNVRDGLAAVADALIGQLTTTDVHVSTEVVGLTKSGDEFTITAADGRRFAFDQVVLALPPVPARALVDQLGAGGGEIRAIYEQQQYFAATTAIHTDPIYMPPDPTLWASYNARRDGDHCEASMWYGAIQQQTSGLPIFKSWITHRREAPASVLATADYWHPNVTPAFIDAQRALDARQGDAGIWFAGTHTYDVDSQESALISACRVASRLAPTSPQLLALDPAIDEIW
jgi:predicted NAD/FAD-binding protein